MSWLGSPSWSASSARRMDRTRASRRLASPGGNTRMGPVVLKPIASMLVGATAAFALGAAVPAATQKKSDVDWNAVGQAFGIQPTAQSGGVWRIDIPRTDLKVMVPRTDPGSPKTFQVKPFF